MKEFRGSTQSLIGTPFGYMSFMIGRRWRLAVIYWLIEYDVIRFNGLQRLMDTITYKTLSSQLQEMETDGLLMRTEYPQISPKVGYRLSGKGCSLYPIMEVMRT